jgi:hypothetical protein
MSEFLNPHITRPAIRWTSGDALPAIEQTGQAAPLLIDSTTGRLLVDTEANLTADLSDIESKQDVTNGILATTAADTAIIKSNSQKSGLITMSNSSVGTTSDTLLTANSATKSLAIQNTSANILYVSTTTPATSTNGILLAAGQGYEFSIVPTNALYALGSAASTTYTIWYS